MRPRRALNRLRLGPVVGHTDDLSSKIWIQVFDNPADYKLRVIGVGNFDFVSTETGPPEFGTAIAKATGLRSDWRYNYSVVRRGRRVLQSKGTFRTMPGPSSLAPIVFCPISCNKLDTDGAWEALAKFVEDAKPSFVVLMGDQCYMDEDDPNVYENHFTSESDVRRQAFAEKYRLSWSRPVIQRVLANVPTYMLWDDHDARDGWGSLASDSPTLVSKYPRGTEIFLKSNAYFEDARDAYWHFQACRNPLPGEITETAFAPYIGEPPARGQRRAMPFAFRSGRVALLMVESRGERDVFREKFPILGAEQWLFIERFFANLPADIDAIAVVTPTPIASMDPNGQTQKLVGARTDDVDAFKKGYERAVLDPYSTQAGSDLGLAIVGAKLSNLTGHQINLGAFKVSNIDEARDQWSHAFARGEQRALLDKANRARFSNRPSASPRELIFLSGDIHVGCIFDIALTNPKYRAVSLTSSGISAKEEPKGSLFIGSFIDKDFEVAPGIRSTLRNIITNYNFGVVQVQPTGTGAKIQAVVAHEGNGFAVGLDIAKLI